MAVKADITIDIDKQVGELQNLTQIYNARVGDNKTPLTIAWRKNDLPLNLKGLHAYIVGKTGDGSYNSETGKIDFPVNTPVSKFEDDGSGTLDGGQSGLTTLLIPKQMWQNSGLFAGYIGLKSEDGSVFTSKDIWFKVLGNVLDAGVQINYFIGDFDKALAEAEKKLQDKTDNFDQVTAQALQDLKNKYDQEVATHSNALVDDTTQLRRLAQDIGELSLQISALGLETNIDHDRDIHNLENKIQSVFSDISYAPEVYLDLDAVSKDYPNGSKKLIITSDGKTAIWDGSKWVSGSAYQAVGLSDQEVRDNHIQSINLQNIINSYATKGKATVWKPSTSPISSYNIYYNNNEVALNKTDATRNDFGILFPVKLDRLPQANENLYIDLTYWTSNNDNLDDRVDVYLWGTDKPIKQYWYGGKASGIVHVEVPKTDFDEYKINNEFNVLVALHGGAGSIDIVDFRVSYDSDNVSLSDKMVNLSPLTRTNGFKMNQATLWPARTDTNKKLYFSNNLAVVSYDDTFKQSQGIEFVGDIDHTLTNYISFKCELLSGNDCTLIISADGSAPSNQGVVQHNQGFQKIAFKLTPEDCKNLGITNKIHIIIGGSDYKLIAVEDLRISPFANSATAINAINNKEYYGIYNDLSPWKKLSYTEQKYGLNLDAFANANKSNINGLLYGTVGEPNQSDGKLKSINLYATQAGTTDFCVAKVDQNGLLVDSRKYSINYQAGANHFDYSNQNIDVPEGAQVFLNLSSLGLFENTNIPLYSDFQIQTTDHTSTNPNYPGNPLYATDKMIPFNFTVETPTVYQQVDDLKDQYRTIEEQVTNNSNSIIKNSKKILTAPNGNKFKLVVGNDGSLTAVSTIPKK